MGAVRHLYRGDPLPDLSEFDILVGMGGPMSVNNEAALAWLALEAARARGSNALKKLAAGVCLKTTDIAAPPGKARPVARIRPPTPQFCKPFSQVRD